MRKIFLAIIAVLVAGVGFYLLMHWLGGDDLSVRPPRATTGVGAPLARESSAIVKVFVSYSALQAAVENAFPKQRSASGEGSQMTHPFGSFLGPGPGVSIGYRWSILAERGNVTINGKGDLLHVDIPIIISGWGGLRGDGAALVGLDRKNVRGRLAVSLDLKARVNENWEPVLTAQPNYNWTEPAQVEAIGGVWVDVTSQVDGPLREGLRNAVVAAVASIDKQAVRKAMQPQWRSRQFRLTNPAGYTLQTTITPMGAGFSGLGFEPQGVSFVLAVRAATQTVFSASDANEFVGPPLPLPKLEGIPGQNPESILDLPVAIHYDALRSAVKAGAPPVQYPATSPLGKGTVKLEDLEIYPTSNNRIAVGLKVVMKFEERLLDTRGWVWLTAAPRLLSDEQTLQFVDPQFTAHADNEIWNALKILLHGHIENMLLENGTLRFGPQIDLLRSELLLKLRDPKLTGGVQCSATDLAITLDNLVLADGEIRAIVHFKAKLACSLPTLPNS